MSLSIARCKAFGEPAPGLADRVRAVLADGRAYRVDEVTAALREREADWDGPDTLVSFAGVPSELRDEFVGVRGPWIGPAAIAITLERLLAIHDGAEKRVVPADDVDAPLPEDVTGMSDVGGDRLVYYRVPGVDGEGYAGAGAASVEGLAADEFAGAGVPGDPAVDAVTGVVVHEFGRKGAAFRPDEVAAALADRGEGGLAEAGIPAYVAEPVVVAALESLLAVDRDVTSKTVVPAEEFDPEPPTGVEEFPEPPDDREVLRYYGTEITITELPSEASWERGIYPGALRDSGRSAESIVVQLDRSLTPGVAIRPDQLAADLAEGPDAPGVLPAVIAAAETFAAERDDVRKYAVFVEVPPEDADQEPDRLPAVEHLDAHPAPPSVADRDRKTLLYYGVDPSPIIPP